MGADIVSLSISGRTGIKHTSAYEQAWKYLDRTLFSLNLSGHLDLPIYDYLMEVIGWRAQQEVLGHRPNGKHVFEYAFPDFAGLSWCAAALVSHWFRLSLALWEPWLRGRIEREGIVITTDFETIAHLVASGGFAQLRGATWYVKADTTSLYRQDTRGIEKLLRRDLTSEETKQVALVEEGHCRCPVCACLYLSGDSINRFRYLLSASEPDFFEQQELFWWVAALRQPDTQLFTEILTAWAPFATRDGAYSGEVDVHDAFYWLCRRLPGAYEVLKTVAISNVPEQQAAVVAGLHGEYMEGRVSAQAVYDMAGPAIAGSYGETMAALRLLRDCPPADQFAYWDAQIQQALHQHGEERYLGTRLRSAAVNLWVLMYAEQEPPAHVKAKVVEHHAWAKGHWPQGTEALKRWGILS